MLDLIEIEKVLDESENVTFTLSIKKEMLDGFIMVFNGLMEVNNHLCVKIKTAENKVKARIDAHQKATRAQHEAVKDHIRETYLEHLKDTLNSREAFKRTKTKYVEYAWLVAKIRKEFKAKRELEIIRLHNKGLKSREVAQKVHISPGAVRKIIGAWKYHGETSAEEEQTEKNGWVMRRSVARHLETSI